MRCSSSSSLVIALLNELRTALGDRARSPRFIRTVHGFGDAFCAEVRGDWPAASVAMAVFRGHEFPLRAGSNVLGRDPSADVQIDDSTVSRRHATIDVRDDGATVEDLSSKNGTFLEGVKLKRPMPLKDGQTVVLGDARVRFRRTGASGSTVTVSRRM